MLSFVKLRVLFTADDHFGHDGPNGIIKTCRRPYASVAEMNADLIRRWNAVVTPDDVVIHLGDFAMGLPALWPGYLEQLNGRKILVMGNHDRAARWYHGGFDTVCRNEIILVDGVRVWVNHYPVNTSLQPMRHRRPPAPGDYDIALCGHVHNAWLVQNGVINVGVDVWDGQPIGLDRLLPLVPA